MTKWQRRLRAFHFLYFGKDDPMKHCEVYKSKGCSHIDGMLCDMRKCKILKNEGKR